MNFLKTTLLLLAACTLFACKKTKKTTSAQQEATKYADCTKLKPGNYWVYAEYVTDTGGVDSATGLIDSCYISKDTMIGDKAYYKYVTTRMGASFVYYLRDSLSYLVTDGGNILFSSQDFTHTFRSYYYISQQFGPQDSIALISEYMSYKDVPVLTPCGVYKTSSFVRVYEMHPYYNAFGKRRFYRYAYAENIGLVTETAGWYVQASRVYEKRLLRYHVE